MPRPDKDKKVIGTNGPQLAKQNHHEINDIQWNLLLQICNLEIQQERAMIIAMQKSSYNVAGNAEDVFRIRIVRTYCIMK